MLKNYDNNQKMQKTLQTLGNDVVNIKKTIAPNPNRIPYQAPCQDPYQPNRPNYQFDSQNQRINYNGRES